MSQFGLRPEHSTTTTLFHITDDITKAVDERNLTYRIPFELYSKHKFFGFSIDACHLTKVIYRIEHKNCYRWNCVRGFTCTQRFPQGSIVGPLLSTYIFLTFIIIHHYADDTRLCISFKFDYGHLDKNRDLQAMLQITLCKYA